MRLLPPDQPLPERLVDRFGRHVTYLRISVTDRCNFRCLYCMSEEMTFLPRAQVLTLEEIREIAAAFAELGVRKIRITGGEPLIRRNILWLFEELGALPGLRELVLTTNGALLAQYAEGLRRAGVRRINISLDSLDPERFRRISRTGRLADVLDGVEAARRAGFERIKLNAVILRGFNEDEIPALVRYALARDLDITFIEEMPLGEVDGHDRLGSYCSSDEVRAEIERHWRLLPTTETTGGPARYWRIDGTGCRVGFISPHSHNFCATCNRVRLTAEGRLLLCLGQEHSVDLRHVVRAHPGDRDILKRAIVAAMDIKPQGHEFDLAARPAILRHMNVTGG
ncbi:GTP 3',8-cyclase MoaA [Inmirania thermothiophila]|uniref:GTP 3',8-cyclase n=1 Tax=Inmirania thermothiophila TaxID=1750597 RepID=A0A3N1Y4W1_9GAMM|nr:GTP 3',8-cyclase MoaA [Inmirania thermothiophila]ROR32327.1 cyclic pyranopterin monophosphate synthase subunit MoaA [Inmirania thermothiophila]